MCKQVNTPFGLSNQNKIILIIFVLHCLDLFKDEKPKTEVVKSENNIINDGESEYEPRVKNTLTKDQIVEFFCNIK